MKLSPKQYAKALHEALEQTHADHHDKVVDKFVTILAQNGDLNKHDAIHEEFLKLSLSVKGIKEAKVTSARTIENSSGLVNDLNRILEHKVELREKVNQDLVGGVVIKVDDTLIDASIKGQLERLNEELKS